MNRYCLITLLGTALVLPASHAQPGYDVEIQPRQVAPKLPAPKGPSPVEKQAQKDAQAQATRDRLARENKQAAARRKATERELAAEKAKIQAAQDAIAEARRQAEVQKIAEKMNAESVAIAKWDRENAPGTRSEAYAGGPVLVALEGGLFDMGSSQGGADERPVHKELLFGRFAIGETEVSFAQWDACVNDSGNPKRCVHKPEGRWGRGAQPVMGVSYDDITQQYLPWLNDKTKATPPYRLPTEAEWEYAARAGSSGEYSLGPTNSAELDRNKANFDKGNDERTTTVHSPTYVICYPWFGYRCSRSNLHKRDDLRQLRDPTHTGDLRMDPHHNGKPLCTQIH